MYSLTVREIFKRFHGFEVGLYTIGPCERGPDNFAPGTTIGRYSSIYYTVSTLAQDMSENSRIPQGLFAASELGVNESGRGDSPSTLVIGNDVFIGHNAIILPSVERIGDGAFVGAGSVVKKTVPPYAVVMGNPARVVRYRFSEKTIEELMESQWWMKSIAELAGQLEEFQKPLEGDGPVR